MNLIKRLYDELKTLPEVVFDITFLVSMIAYCIVIICSGCTAGKVTTSGDLVFPQIDMWWKG